MGFRLTKTIFGGKNTAFTLAEVLITLTIIGVIAALTIPTLMKNIQEHAWHQQWKSTYALINNAVKMAGTENPDLRVILETDYTLDLNYINSILNYLKVVDSCVAIISLPEENNEHYCEQANTPNSKTKWSGIYYNYTGSNYKTLAGYNLSADYFYEKAALLKNGAAIYFGIGNKGGGIVVDVNNSTKGPNILGKDVYALNFYVKGNLLRRVYDRNSTAEEITIAPYGTDTYSENPTDKSIGINGCSPNIGTQSNVNNLKDAPGSGCSYKYLYDK